MDGTFYIILKKKFTYVCKETKWETYGKYVNKDLKLWNVSVVPSSIWIASVRINNISNHHFYSIF